MKKLFLTLSLAAFLIPLAAQARDEAPVPHRSPRVPVRREALASRRPSLRPDSTVKGQATVVDTDKLNIGDVHMRLFGVVPPQLSASFGPQARETLDNLVASQIVSCLVRDRDQGGRYLAICQNAAGQDLALELLRRGLAVTARGSLASTDLDAPYLEAEQAAQAQKLGLWSVTVPAAAAVMPSKLDVKKNETLVPLLPPPAPAATKSETVSEKVPAQVQPRVSLSSAAAAAAPLAASSLAPAAADETLAVPEGPGFFARYQLLITGFIMLATALGIFTVVSRQRRQEKSDEMKALAAALRGELMAARAVCQARLKTMGSESDEKNVSWPRIRSTLYQAYVGRLGFLGAELARQVASIYGQASDYAAYYNSDDDARADSAPKRQALQSLIQHIEEVLPKLEMIEHAGLALAASAVRPSADAPHPVTVQEGSAPSRPPSPAQLWNSVRKFTRERFAEPAVPAHDETDYAALIEEEIAGMTFGEGEDDANAAQMPDNVTKMRTGS